MNTQGVMMYLNNPSYRRAIDSAEIIYPDGWGPVVASWFFPKKLPERSNAGDFSHALLSLLNDKHFSIYLLGCEAQSVKQTAFAVQKRYPFIHIAGYHSGFFSKKMEHNIVRMIAKSKPHIVLVGMGIPNQELFIKRNWKHLPRAVYWGVGGVFYYLSQEKSRAPVWMRKYCMEWLYRFIQEPKRLWKRYTITNLSFIVLFFRSLISKKK